MPAAKHQRDTESRMHVPYSKERARQKRAGRPQAQRCHLSQRSPPQRRKGPGCLPTSRRMEQTSRRLSSQARDKQEQRSHRGEPHQALIRKSATNCAEQMDTHLEAKTNWPEPPAYSPVHYEDKREMGTRPTEKAGRTETQVAHQHPKGEGACGASSQTLYEECGHGITTITLPRKPLDESRWEKRRALAASPIQDKSCGTAPRRAHQEPCHWTRRNQGKELRHWTQLEDKSGGC